MGRCVMALWLPTVTSMGSFDLRLRGLSCLRGFCSTSSRSSGGSAASAFAYHCMRTSAATGGTATAAVAASAALAPAV